MPDGIEGLATQRTRRPTRRDDPHRPLDKGTRRRRREPDGEQVRSVLGVVLDLLAGLERRLVLLSLFARLDEDSLAAAVPTEGQDAGAERFVERLVERCRIVLKGRVGVGDAPVLELVEELVQAVGEDCDLDLFEGDRHDPIRIARLEKERPLAGLTDRAGDEAVGWIEDVAPSSHALTVPRRRHLVGQSGAMPMFPRQPTETRMVCQPLAPSGAGGVGCSSWSAPVPSVARTEIVWSPGVAFQS